ncbi:MAG: hypothetical protein RR207_04820 [Clostridia bacterium]
MKAGRLFLLVTALVLTVALAGTTTFAWFTMNDTVGVTGINFNVGGSEGLMISANGTTGSYRANLKSSDTAIGMPGATEIVLKPVTPKLASGAWDTTGGTFSFLDRANADKGDVKTWATGKDFFVQKFWLKSDEKMDIKFATLEVIAKDGGSAKTFNNIFTAGFDADGTGGNAYLPDSGKTLDVSYYGGTGADLAYGEAVTAQAQNAIRFAVFTIANGVYTLSFISNPNYDKGWKDNNLAADLYDVIENKGLKTNVTESTGIVNGIPTSVVGQVAADGTPLQIAVVVWLEGKDGDCFNGIIGDNLTINFSFKGTKVV